MLLTTPERFQENPRQFLDILHYEAVALTLSEEKSLVLSADLMTHWEHMEDHSAEIDVSVSFFAEEGGIYLDRLLNGSKVNVILEDGKALQLSGEVLDQTLVFGNDTGLILTEDDLAALENGGELER